jgi:PAS domain S-box-containing protein
MADTPENGHARIGGESPRLAVDGLPDHALVMLDPHGVITGWNGMAERLFGRRSEQAVGVHISAVAGDGPDAAIRTSHLEQAERQGGSSGAGWLAVRDGTRKYVRTTLLPVRNDTSVLGYVLAVHAVPVADVSGGPDAVEREVDDASLADARRQLAESKTQLAAEIAVRTQAETSRTRLLRRLVVAEEDQRRRLARELHDGLGQRLTALRLTLQMVDGHDGLAGGRRATIGNALEMLTEIDQDLDFIAWELRPAELDELGLANVLATYVREWSRHAGIPAVFHSTPGSPARFAPALEASVYRIAQEALNNVVKHARAHAVNVLLQLHDDTLTLIVEDDGIGLPRRAAGETMIGLTGMRERALALGGTLDVEPTPGGGTTVVAAFPTSGGQRDHPPERSRMGLAGAAHPVSADAAPESTATDGPLMSEVGSRLQELHRAVGARDEFIATVAHELRNPIAPLTFLVRLALNRTEQIAAAGTPVSIDWVQAQLRGVEQRLHRLLETLDRLLDVSRLSTGRIDLQTGPMNLGEVVRDVIDAFDAELAVARCQVTLTERGEATGIWDRLRVEQVCRNLLSNAIRFGAGRPIEIAVDASHDVASMTVRDHGVGIAHDQQSKIFERFERGVEQRSGGFGVGLWIVRNICVAMGGTVSVDSTPGDGACFTVVLPRHPARRAGGPAPE